MPVQLAISFADNHTFCYASVTRDRAITGSRDWSRRLVATTKDQSLEFTYDLPLMLFGVSTQLQSSGLVAHENSTFRNLALAVSGPFMV